MIAKIGDIYVVYEERLQQYAACQVIRIKEQASSRHKVLAAVLELDWHSDQLPTEVELQHIKPLVCNYYFWNDRWDYSFVDANVPKHYRLVGNIPPLIEAECNSYASWRTGGSLYRQLQWEAIPAELRARFKAAAGSDEQVNIAGFPAKLSTSTIRQGALEQLEDWSELHKLPCLTAIHTSHPYKPELIDYLRDTPFITELSLDDPRATELDFTGTSLNRLILKADDVESLTLPKGLSQLSLVGTVSEKLRIYAEHDGKELLLMVDKQATSHYGLSQLGALNIRGVADIDLAELAGQFPHLHELRIWGAPGYAANMGKIVKLIGLHTFTTYDLFGFTGEEFPLPDTLPQLSMLWLDSLPADAAKTIKARYKKAAASGLDLSVTKPRKPEWMAENLTNPFRDWDGREHITSTNAKKAMNLYKKMLGELGALEKQAASGMNAAEVHAALAALVTDFTATLNKMDSRSGFIETIEREEIYEVLHDLLKNTKLNLAESGIKVDLDKLIDIFDAERDF
ncbi:hypothetical protein [Paenibacillus sp. Leaf72]|uniref:hypothetical protein n=1 Tax=Paenibacillus sp. Leaf72 TaxID=1736234 RepID=UPI0006F6D28B|nr:hypothetical protein [Paenibacillus sp. Leaf72]KQO10760.1 hypothetical protein ASF12_10220 [Paenibacillus sp. Leaf72]